jgi:phage-related protein
MLTLSSVAIQEKNKLASDSVFCVALEITIPDVVEPIRVINNSEDIAWNGSTWTAFPFVIEEISDVSSGEVPRVDVRVSNVNRIFESYLQTYDTYCKVNGFEPIEVSIFVINTLVCATVATPEVEHQFELKQPKTNSQWATFTLGASNPFARRFPQNRILKNHCRYKYKGSDHRCGSTHASANCTHTLTACRARLNSGRFGNAPGVGSGGFDVL